MRRRTILLTLAVVLVAAGAIAAPATAANNSTSTASSSSSTAASGAIVSPVSGERIDNSTVLKQALYYPQNATAVFTLRSSEPQAITISGAFREGEIPRRTVVVRGTETVRMRIPPTSDGFVGATIATDAVLFGVPLEESSTLDVAPPASNDLLALGIGGIVGPILVLLGLKIRRYRADKGVTEVAG